MLEQTLISKPSNVGPGVNTTVLIQAALGYRDVARGLPVSKFNVSEVSSVNAKFDGVSFDFQQGYVKVGAASDFVWKSTDTFTIEWWQNVIQNNGNNWFLAGGTGTSSCLKIYTTDLYLQTEGNAYGWINTNTALTLNTWQHIAIVQTGGVMKLYVDGVVRMSFNANGNFGRLDTVLSWGGGSTSNLPCKGYMDQFRVSKIARYTEAFTPPTTPFVVD